MLQNLRSKQLLKAAKRDQKETKTQFETLHHNAIYYTRHLHFLPRKPLVLIRVEIKATKAACGGCDSIPEADVR